MISLLCTIQARSQPQTSGEPASQSSSPIAKSTSSSTTSPASKTPRNSSSKSDQTPAKSDRSFSSSKTPVMDKSSADEKPRDLRRSIDGEGGDKKWSGKGGKALSKKRYVFAVVFMMPLDNHVCFCWFSGHSVQLLFIAD